MRVLNFEASLSEIENGKCQLADNSKTWLYNENPDWFDIIDFENDKAFLEPLLFYYFRRLILKEKPVTTLEQIFYGYTPIQNRTKRVKVITDVDGTIYLPNYGYLNTHTQGIKEMEIFQTDSSSNDWICENKVLSLIPIKYIKDNSFSIISPYKTDIFREKGVVFIEDIEQSTNKAECSLIKTLNCMEHNDSDFYAAIQKTTSEYCIFNSTNFESFTALHHFGTAFLNLAGQDQTEAFYIDDIAHQSGHTIFYTLTHEFEKFLKPHRLTLLNEFTQKDKDERSVYGAFHGLFTYTTILHNLHNAVSNQWFKSSLIQEELLARMGFYYDKFEKDLVFQGDDRILTKEGWRYYEMFYTGFFAIKKEYHHIIKYFDYSNQDYNFNFEKFQQVNQRITV